MDELSDEPDEVEVLEKVAYYLAGGDPLRWVNVMEGMTAGQVLTWLRLVNMYGVEYEQAH